MKTLILIPTYNERENILSIISDIRKIYPEIGIMVIDDNSPDGTGEVVKGLMNQDSNISILERSTKNGLGSAYVEALKNVRNMADVENVITMDADGSHDPAHLAAMLGKIKEWDVVIGSRYVNGGDTENWEWYRKLLSKWGNLYSQMILDLPVRDLTAGFVCFRRIVLDALDLDYFDSAGYAYQIEFKYYCMKKGFRVTEIPIIFRERREGISKISTSIVWDGLILPVKLLLKARRKW